MNYSPHKTGDISRAYNLRIITEHSPKLTGFMKGTSMHANRSKEAKLCLCEFGTCHNVSRFQVPYDCQKQWNLGHTNLQRRWFDTWVFILKRMVPSNAIKCHVCIFSLLISRFHMPLPLL